MLKNQFFRSKVIPNALLEVFRPQKFREGEERKGRVEDESVGDFVERRFGKSVADVLVGALCTGSQYTQYRQTQQLSTFLLPLSCLPPIPSFLPPLTHLPGIYSTNSRRLSIRSCFPSLLSLEKQYGSVVGGLVGGWLSKKKAKNGGKEEEENARVKREKEGRVKSGVYSFKRGMESVVLSLSSSLSHSPAVSVLLSSPVRKVEVGKEGKVGVVFGEKEKERMEFDHVFSALPLNALGDCIASSHEELGFFRSLLFVIFLFVPIRTHICQELIFEFYLDMDFTQAPFSKLMKFVLV